MLHRLAIALAGLVAVLPVASVAQTAAPPSASEGTTAIIVGQGTVSRPPDTATITASIQTNDDIAANATSKNNTTFSALTSALGALHVDPADIKTTYYNVSFNPRPMLPPMAVATATPMGQSIAVYPYPGGARYGYNVNRQVAITVARVGDVGALIDAVVKSGVTNVNGVQYGLKDRAPANEAALALALADAANQAKVVAAASHMRLGGIKQIQVGQAYGGPVPVPMRGASLGVPGAATEIAPAAVDVRASVTVTYYLKP